MKFRDSSAITARTNPARAQRVFGQHFQAQGGILEAVVCRDTSWLRDPHGSLPILDVL